MSETLDALEKSLRNLYTRFSLERMPCGICFRANLKALVMESFRRHMDHRLSEIDIQTQPFQPTAYGIPVYFCDRQVEDCRVYTDQQELADWLKFQVTGEFNPIKGDWENAGVIARFLVNQRGRDQPLTYPEDLALLESALVANGYCYREPTPNLSPMGQGLEKFVQSINLKIAILLSQGSRNPESE